MAGQPSAADAPDRRGPPIISRRRFLTGSAAAALTAVLAGHVDGVDRLMAALSEAATGVEPDRPDASDVYTFSVERDTDLVELDVTFNGFTRSPALKIGRPVTPITALVPGSGNVITVQFPPQAIGEAAYPYSGNPWPVDPPPVLSVLAGPSRLCFTTDKDVTFSAPMLAGDLLDWSDWTLLLPAVAAAKPTAEVTSIEYPYGLYLAPAATSGHTTTFAGASLVNPATQVTDCWTAALSISGTGVTPSMAAVWARDYVPKGHAAVPGATPDGPISIHYET